MKLRIRETPIHPRHRFNESLEQKVTPDSEHPKWKLYGYEVYCDSYADTPFLIFASDKSKVIKYGKALAKIFDKSKYDIETLRKEVDNFYKELPGSRADGIDENGKGLECFTPRYTDSPDMYEKINNDTYIVYTGTKYYYVYNIGSANFV